MICNAAENLDRPIRRKTKPPGLGGRRSKHANDSHGGLLSPASKWTRNKGDPLGGQVRGEPDALTGRFDLPAASGARRDAGRVEGQFGSPGWIRTSDHSINSRML